MTLFLLFLMQLIWAASYMVQKEAMIDMPVGLVLIFRYGISCLIFLFAGQYKLKTKFSKREWSLIIITGLLVFSGSPFCQLTALTHTYATDTAIMTSFEPLIAALLATTFLKERIGWKTLAASLVATTGMIIMTGWQGDWTSLHTQRILGDTFFLVSLFFEGIGSTASRHLVQKRSPFELLAWMMLVGFSANLIGYSSLLTKNNLAAIHMKSWFAVSYLALFCSVLAYGGWTYLLKRIPLNKLALSIFLQPLFGTILAYFMLHEPLDFRTLLGGGLIIFSLSFWLLTQLKRKKPAMDYPIPAEAH